MPLSSSGTAASQGSAWLNQSLLETPIHSRLERAAEHVGGEHARREEAREHVAIRCRAAAAACSSPSSSAPSSPDPSLGGRAVLVAPGERTVTAGPHGLARPRTQRLGAVLGVARTLRPRRRLALCRLDSCAMACFVPRNARRCSPSGGGVPRPPGDAFDRRLEAGRGREARTPDLRIWNPLLYQLSYTPRLCALPTSSPGAACAACSACSTSGSRGPCRPSPGSSSSCSCAPCTRCRPA